MTSLFSKQTNDPSLKNIIRGNEKCVFYDNIKRKRQLIDWDESSLHMLKAELVEEKLFCVYGGMSTALFF